MKRFTVFFLLAFAIISQSLVGQERHVKLDGLNSSYDEYGPVLSPDGNRLYFTIAGHAANVGGVIDQGDIWYADRTDAGWSQAQNAGELINHPGLNGVVGFSADGNRMYLLNYFEIEARGNGKLKNGISYSEKVGGEWQRPKPLNIQFFTNMSSHISASITPDEEIMIISMRSFQTEGNEDLYVSINQGEQWSEPLSLGPVINTDSEEWTPYITPDKQTLYFASNGHETVGSRDIFMSERLGEDWTSWSKPVPLGGGINTEGTERSFYIKPGERLAYFSTTQNSEGFGDIFGFELPDNSIEEVVVVSTPVATPDPEPEPANETQLETESETEVVTVVPEEEVKQEVNYYFNVLDKRTDTPIDGQVTFNFDNKEVGINTADTGSKFPFSFIEGTSITVNIEAKGFLKFSEEFISTPDSLSDQVDKVFYLTPEDVGTTVTIENVLFNRASSSFANENEAKREIDKLISLMKENPGMAIRLEGHTDNRGNARLLKELSEDRVKAVRRYMITRGIAGSRIDYVGYGGEKPLSSGDSDQSRLENRRVEFVIIR